MYYISKDFEVSTLEHLFSTFELHESRVSEPNEAKKTSQNIALKAKMNSSDSEASVDESEAALLVRRFNKFFSSNKFKSQRHHRKKRAVRCYNCNEEGHIKEDCPKLKKKEKEKEKPKYKKPEPSKYKNLKATWSDSSTSESDIEEFLWLALLANHQLEEDSRSEMSIDEGGGTSEEESSSERGASPDQVSKVRNLSLIHI